MRRSMTLIVAASLALASAGTAAPPNIIVVNIDDMGYGDLPSFGNTDPVDTPTLDALAAGGLQFRQYYASSPLCSASRAGLLTGQYPSRWQINSFLGNRAENKRRDTADFLAAGAPSLARTLQQHGYATGHFGKWHLGGGRNVGDAPLPSAYGFDESFTQFEGLGDRALIVGHGLSNASAALGLGDITWVDSKNELSALYVDKAIDFIGRRGDQPFYLNLWPDDVHDPYDPKPELVQKYAGLGVADPDLQKYYATLDNLDAQLGRLVAHVDAAGLGDDTIIVVVADNGPTAAGQYYHTAQGDFTAPGSTGGLRGRKSSLYEGGVREPLIVRWTGAIDAGGVNAQTAVAATDLFPSLLAMARLAPPAGVALDGNDLSSQLLGKSEAPRQTALYWDYGRNSNNIRPFLANDRSPNLAMRQGDWKLLMNADGTRVELYNLSADARETTNLAGQQPALAQNMSRSLLAWRYEQPSIIPPGFEGDASDPRLVVRLKADGVAGGNGAAVGAWQDSAVGDSLVGSVFQSDAAARPVKRTNAVNGRAAIEFDGVNDVLASSQNNALPTSGNGVTVFVVATSDDSGASAERVAQLGSSSGAGGSVVGFDLSRTSTATSDGGAGFRFNNGRATYDAGLDDDDFHIVAFRVGHGQSYADAAMFVDGTTEAARFTGSSSNAAGATSFSGGDLELLLGTGRLAGGGLAPGDHYGGKVAELLVYNEQLSVEEINLVANYLSTEYDLPFDYALPAHVANADFDADGDVDGGDLLNWQRGAGSGPAAAFAAGDADGDGTIDSADLAVWQAQFAAAAPSNGLAARVPEPATAAMALLAALAATPGPRWLQLLSSSRPTRR